MKFVYVCITYIIQILTLVDVINIELVPQNNLNKIAKFYNYRLLILLNKILDNNNLIWHL